MAIPATTTAPAAEESSFMGMKWSDITKALSDKNVQRGIAQFGRDLSLGPVDPRTGRPTEGTGSRMAGTADKFLRSMNFQENAAKQARQKQLYDEAMMEYFKSRTGRQGQGMNNEMLSMLSGMLRRPSTAGATSSAGWLDDARGPRIE